jgi:hypothetical protein
MHANIYFGLSQKWLNDKVSGALEIRRLLVIKPHRDRKIRHQQQNPRLELPQVQTAKAVLSRGARCISKTKTRL